jgi:hypothetical protein
MAELPESVRNVTDPLELAERYGVDVLRYFLLRDVAFGSDGSYSPEAIVTRANAELANSFGNLVQRVLSFIAKNCDGGFTASAPVSEADRAAGLTPLEAIRAATGDAARILGAADLGTIAAGKVADLVVLDADPVADIRNTRRIRAVVQGGRVVDRARIREAAVAR